MAHTQDAVVIDATGAVHLVIRPDNDWELDDPAFSPTGYTHLRVPHNPVLDPIAQAQALHPAMNVQWPAPHMLAQGPAGNITGNGTVSAT